MSKMPGPRQATTDKSLVSNWAPPDFAGQKRTRIGASVVEQFVSGHDASDVLRELVQNEFDGQGDRLLVTFGETALEVVGNGKGVSRDGWKRLSVIVGTGRVVGDDHGDRVAAKTNGIGSKNFGLRSLFIFGDEIYVRSGGQVCVLDLRTLETGRVADRDYWGGLGVRIQVPFRRETFEMMEPFSPRREAGAFDIMANGMLATLVKLALPGSKPGLRKVTLRSSRVGRTLDWKQEAESLRSPMKGISVVRRTGRLIDSHGDLRVRRDFSEIEFIKSVEVPAEYLDREYPAYFQARGGAIKIAVSLPLLKTKLDTKRAGHFHYPLQAPDARTGCAVGVSAPFALDNDRSNLTDHGWNNWLQDEAARFTIDLITGDWFDRFGAASFEALVPNGTPSPSRYIDEVFRRLNEQPCWPTRGADSQLFALASKTVVVADQLLDGFLPDNSYLADAIAGNEAARQLAIKSGTKEFSLQSLVRFRCAGADKGRLETKLKPEEGNWHFPDYLSALKQVERQVRMASSLTALGKHLSVPNRNDLKNTPSTLSATGELHAAKDLIIVAPEIWDVCPEPMEHRLHPQLAAHKAISGSCKAFDEQTWMIEAAARAVGGVITAEERSALYARITDENTRLGRAATQAIRSAPVCKDNKGEWVAPADMVALSGKLARFMAPVVHAPSKEMVQTTGLVQKLKIRDLLSSGDLVAYATAIAERPATALQFETLLSDNIRLITPAARSQLRGVPFLRNKAGSLSSPEELHLDTSLNRAMIGRDEALVSGHNEGLYRRLEIAEHPTVDTLVAVIGDYRDRSARPASPELIYPALVAGLRREGRPRHDLSGESIIWHNGSFHCPGDVLIGSVPRVLDNAVTVIRRVDEVAGAFLSLGARSQASESDWERFFRRVCADWDRKALPSRTARLLTDAYQVRAGEGLPPNIDDLECLVTRNGHLYSLDELRNGSLVENDFPALAEALAEAGIQLGIVDITDRNRAFFHKLRLQPLSVFAGAGKPVFGGEAKAPVWIRPHHVDTLVAMLKRPIFARALHAIAFRRRFMFERFAITSVDDLCRQLEQLQGVIFYDRISRRYEVRGDEASVSIEAAVGDGVIGLVAPRTKIDFLQLVAQALAEMTGAGNAALARTLSNDILPLVFCKTLEDIVVQLERMGISQSGWAPEEEPELEFDDVDAEETSEEVVRQVINALNTALDYDLPPTFATIPVNVAAAPSPPQSQPYSLPPLPDLAGVSLTVADVTDKAIDPPQSRSGGWYGSTGWSPPTGSEVDRDREVGTRGEELVYRMELERVRKAGHPNPEEVVIWTSKTDPGADHDICSIDEAGNPRWIEVKATSGTDGRFDWPRKEFEKAMRERERYELWRVYSATSSTPVAKCFPNPSRLIGVSRMQLELGALKAFVEGLH